MATIRSIVNKTENALLLSIEPRGNLIIENPKPVGEGKEGRFVGLGPDKIWDLEA